MLKSKKSKRAFYNSLVFALLLFTFFPLIISFAEEEPSYDAKGKRNPFIPLVTPDGRLLKLDSPQETGGLAVEGIIFDKYGLSYAIVNGEVVKVSDTIGDYQVLKIEKDKIIFIKNGEPMEIEVNKEGD